MTPEHGDIVTLGGRLKRSGYWKVDTFEAMGATPERPWVSRLGTDSGYYVDPSDLDSLTVVVPAEEAEGMEDDAAVLGYLEAKLGGDGLDPYDTPDPYAGSDPYTTDRDPYQESTVRPLTSSCLIRLLEFEDQ